MSNERPPVDFVGIGPAKSGTTWLYACLKEHPTVCMSETKELDFFNTHQSFWRPDLAGTSNYDKGTEWYAAHFKHCSVGSVRGEISPIYFFAPEVPERIHATAPDAKLIICLRNPVDRMYSHYLYTKEKNVHPVPKTFEEALERYPAFADEGRYFKYIQNYLRFFPHGRIHIVLSEDMRRDQRGTIEGVYRFLGVDPTFMPASLQSEVNERGARAVELRLVTIKRRLGIVGAVGSRIPGAKGAFKRLYARAFSWRPKPPKPSPELRAKLFAQYEDDIAHLEQFLGRQLNWK